jgi:MoxR-like ATPase
MLQGVSENNFTETRSAHVHRLVLEKFGKRECWPVEFLDELPEFPRQALEALRQPMESGRTTVARASAHITYPARFQIVATMNPCRCG